MDEKPQEAEIKALIDRNDAAREAIAIHWHKLRHRADIPARLRDSISSNRTWWFAGSAVLGMLATTLFRKKAPVVPIPHRTARKGLMGLALTTAFAFAKPALKTWLWNEVQKRVSPRSGPRRASPQSRHFSD